MSSFVLRKITNHQTSITKQVRSLFLVLGSWFLVLGSWLLTPAPLRAQDMSSSSYKIRMGNFNMTSGMKNSSSYNLTDTVGQTAAEYFSSSGYHVKAGFQYVYTLYPFSFSVSSLAVDLGTLTPGTAATGNHTLTVTAPGQGYSVSAIESTRLTSTSGATIPDTSCDTSCSETSAGVWTGSTAYGFGYNLQGDDVTADFTGPTYFRPFPDASAAETAATIMSTTSSGKNRTATVTYRANVSGSQAAGTYTTQISYIATPVY
jgi:hypothetical protein